jgi:hypothetical protein
MSPTFLHGIEKNEGKEELIMRKTASNFSKATGSGLSNSKTSKIANSS